MASNIDMVAEQSVPISKKFSGDVATYPKFSQRVKAESVKAGLDLKTIHREPKLADYVTNPEVDIVGYKGAVMTPEQVDKGLSVGDVDLGYKPKKAFEDAAKEYRINKAKYYAIIKRNLN